MDHFTLQLEVPSDIMEKAQRIARTVHRSIEEVLVETLSLLLGDLEFPDAEQLLRYTDTQLWAALYRPMLGLQETRLRDLIAKSKAITLSPIEQVELEKLIEQSDQITLFRSQILKLLGERGYDLSDVLRGI